MRRTICWLAFGLLTATAQAGPWAMSGNVSQVNTANEGRMFLSVSDENGQPVPSLTAANFKVASIGCNANASNCGVYEGTITAVSEQPGTEGAGVYIVAFKQGRRPGVVTSTLGISVVRVGSLDVVSAAPGEVRRAFVQRVQQLFYAR